MKLAWGIIGAGRIAHQFAEGIASSQTGRLVATGSNSHDRASAIADRWGGRAVSYDDVLADPGVEAVYIATPHHLHSEWTKRAAAAGKAILCEKPFTLNHPEAVDALASVRSNGVFFMEAFMYRCSPQMRKVRELLEDGAIGKIFAVVSEFSYGASRDLVNFRTDGSVGGGGLMDVGTYCVSFSRLIAGDEPVAAHYVADLSLGYDAWGAGCLKFPSGIVAHFACGVHVEMRNDATIYGESGHIHVQDPWKCAPGTVMTVHRKGRDPEVFELGCSAAQLYAHEADAVAASLQEGECPWMTAVDTLANMKTLDDLRASCGLTFAREPK